MSLARSAPFGAQSERHDEWFVRHAAAYGSELPAVRALLPWKGVGLSIGVGTGRVPAPTRVQVGIDQTVRVLASARSGGITAIQAISESLPFADCAFDYALCVTTTCFIGDAPATLSEARRVLKPGADW